MRLTKKQLSIIIENFINEDGWLGDEEDNLGDLGLSKLENRLNRLKEESISQIIDELSDSSFSDQNITESMLKVVKQNLRNVSIATTKATASKEISLSAMAICFTSNVTHKKDENKLALQTPIIPSDITDIPKEAVRKYNSSPGKYPIILFVEKNINNDISDQKLKSILLHELGHVKNNTIRSLSLKATDKFGENIGNIQLNRSEVKGVLRKDLKGKTVDEIVDILVSEGWLDKNQADANQELVTELKRFYDGVDDPNNIKAVEELSVRVSELKRNTEAFQKFVINKEVDLYTSIASTFNLDIADIVLLISKDAGIDDLNKIVKATPQKNATVRKA
jgi:hypothetical protein